MDRAALIASTVLAYSPVMTRAFQYSAVGALVRRAISHPHAASGDHRFDTTSENYPRIKKKLQHKSEPSRKKTDSRSRESSKAIKGGD